MIAKRDVHLNELHPTLRRLEPVVDDVFGSIDKVAICTSTNSDGYDDQGRKLHRWDSLHYHGMAFDLRIKHVGGSKMQTTVHAALVRQIELAWPGIYDVLLEHPGSLNAHVHIEVGPALAVSLLHKEV